MSPMSPMNPIKPARSENYNRFFAYNPQTVSVSNREIEYLDTAPQPFTVQIPLVEYFERVKRLKADKWQVNFCQRLQNACQNRHLARTLAIIHAESQLGKSVIQAQILNAWLLGHDPLHRSVLSTYNISRSQDHSEVVIKILQSPIHKDIFTNKGGHIPDKVSKEKWSTYARMDYNDGQFSFKAVGLQSGITGSGFDTLVIDDPYATVADAFSETLRKRLQAFWENDVNSRLSPYSNVFAMFHRYHVQDLAGYLLDKGTFDYWRYASISDGDYIHEETGQRFSDPVGRAPGEYISERRAADYYADKRKNKATWNSMFQGKPSSEEGDFFNVKKITYITPAEAVERRKECVALVRAWDNAATLGGGDYTVGMLGGIRANGKVTVFHAVIEQLDSALRLQKQKNTADADGFDVLVRIPQDPASAGKFEAWATARYLEKHTVIAKPISGSKEMRAVNFSAAVNAGDVEFVSDDNLPEDQKWNKRVITSLRDFPLSNFKDPVDAGSDMYNECYESLIKGLIAANFKPQRNVLGYSTFASLFPFEKDGKMLLKIPKNWTIYAGVKINQDASRPTSAVLVARAAQDTGLKENLFVFAEYKAYDSDFGKLFDWLKRTFHIYCEHSDYDNTTIWLHKDSAHFQQTIIEKLKVNVAVFDSDNQTGLTELNWYFMPNGKAHPANQTEQASNLYLLSADAQLSAATDEQGMMSLRQELSTWGYNDKGEPTAIGAVADCLRMIVAEFSTYATPLTAAERFRERLKSMLPAAMQTNGGELSEVDGSPISVDLTMQMNAAFLRSELRRNGEHVSYSPFDEDENYNDYDDMSGGW